MLWKLLKHFNRNLINATVISLTEKGVVGIKIEKLGIKVHALKMNKSFGSMVKFISLVGLLKKIKPQIVHTRLYHGNLIGGLAAKFAGIDNILWGIYQSNLSFKCNKLSTLMIMRLCALMSRSLPKYIFTNSSSAIYSHVAVGYDKRKFLNVPNGFDTKEFKPDKKLRNSVIQEFGFSVGTPIVGVVARFDPQKNHMGFIDAVIEVKKIFPNVQFILVGPGVVTTNKKLFDAYSTAGLKDNVRFLGSRNDIVRLINSFDVLALPSLGESFPNILGEAMSCSVPCVVTDVGESAHIVGDPNRVSNPNDMIGFGKLIIKVLSLDHEQLSYLGEKARLRIKNNFEIGKIAKIFEKKYKSIIEESIV